jgi:HAMP domain-containing protein
LLFSLIRFVPFAIIGGIGMIAIFSAWRRRTERPEDAAIVMGSAATAIALTVPAQEAQQLAIDIALPISVMIVLLGLIALVSLRLSLRTVTGSLQGLAEEARTLSTGKLDRPLSTHGMDEVGEMRKSFEQMRVSLQARLNELNRLLVASQGVASSLKLNEALEPVIKAVSESGANSARIVLLREMIPSPVEIPLRFSSGADKDVYMHLDQQILSLTEQQERLVMATVTRTRGLDLDPNLRNPESLIAIAIRHEGRYYGVLWAGYKAQHVFSESDIRFISTLASQAALAVANIRLFLTVEASRRQMDYYSHTKNGAGMHGSAWRGDGARPGGRPRRRRTGSPPPSPGSPAAWRA